MWKIMGNPQWTWDDLGGKTPYFSETSILLKFYWTTQHIWTTSGRLSCVEGEVFKWWPTKDSNHFGTCDGQKWHETTGGWLNLAAWEAHDPIAGCVIPRWEVPILCKWSWEWRRCILGFIQFEPVTSGYWWFIFFQEMILPTYDMWIITKPCFIIFSILKPISLHSLASYFTCHYSSGCNLYRAENWRDRRILKTWKGFSESKF